ncbi:hypothetical protein DICVIV_13177 [Dictyocaulus viviparus]|uniref:Uncharacterized protein n=1 Tax=Dictyocaulus viviparus TaxID=29172 RepID=A0A0D8XB32_DICVI|nr:hypothetical protein DICVIV_13177 [Dictyocaulus viviparus]
MGITPRITRNTDVLEIDNHGPPEEEQVYSEQLHDRTYHRVETVSILLRSISSMMTKMRRPIHLTASIFLIIEVERNLRFPLTFAQYGRSLVSSFGWSIESHLVIIHLAKVMTALVSDFMWKRESCFIRDNIVTSICQVRNRQWCAIIPRRGRSTAAVLVPQEYLTLKGTIKAIF